MSNLQAILVASTPTYKCCIFTEDFGPIVISSIIGQNDQPSVESLSILKIEQLALACSHSANSEFLMEGLSEYEIPLLQKLHDSKKGMKNCSTLNIVEDREQRKLLETVATMRGLQERLKDASLSVRLKEASGNLNHFLSRSEAVVDELQSAFRQHGQKINRNGTKSHMRGRIKRRRSDDDRGEQGHSEVKSMGKIECHAENDDLNLPLAYYDALSQQCSQVDQILRQAPTSKEKGSKIELNDNLTIITIHYYDVHNRCHELKGEMTRNFPFTGPCWVYDLPMEFEPVWNGSLAEILENFMENISKYQPLWNELDDIDLNTWVLEPSLPARRSCFERRIVLQNGLSIHLELEPENPVATPLTMRLIGTSKDISDLRNAYHAYISPGFAGHNNDERWSEELSVRMNLEKCFGITLPSPKTTEKTEYIAECGICYAHKLQSHDGKEEVICIPSVTCGNVSCARSYHERCLSEWLHSLPGAKVSFGRIFGQCPYCCDSISVQI